MVWERLICENLGSYAIDRMKMCQITMCQQRICRRQSIKLQFAGKKYPGDSPNQVNTYPLF